MINVLIAEDDFRVAYVHEQFIENMEGFQLTGKSLNAEETLQILETQPVDLILLDNYMPDKLGVSLLSAIRENHQNMDVIMITAATDVQTVETSIKFGVVDYLIKPVTLERFQKVIDNYKARKALLKDKQEIDQALIDQFLNNNKTGQTEKELPKGIDPLTLQKVEKLLLDLEEGCTAEELGEKLGASRTTAGW